MENFLCGKRKVWPTCDRITMMNQHHRHWHDDSIMFFMTRVDILEADWLWTLLSSITTYWEFEVTNAAQWPINQCYHFYVSHCVSSSDLPWPCQQWQTRYPECQNLSNLLLFYHCYACIVLVYLLISFYLVGFLSLIFISKTMHLMTFSYTFMKGRQYFFVIGYTGRNYGHRMLIHST